MIHREWYRHTERIMYDYRSNIERLNDMMTEYRDLETYGDVNTQSFGSRLNGGGGSDRVLEYVHRKQQLERAIKRLKSEIAPIHRIREKLKRNLSEEAEKLELVLEAVYLNSSMGQWIGVYRMPREEVYTLRHKLVSMVARALFQERKRLRK